LPFDSPTWAIQTMESYIPIAHLIKSKGMNVQDVLEIFNTSCSILDRTKLEAKYHADIQNIVGQNI